jgi:hypothetical protein
VFLISCYLTCWFLHLSFSYTLFPLLLLLDAAIDCRSPQKVDTDVMPGAQKMPRKVSDYVAEGVLQCLEELLKKCQFRSVNQVLWL